MNRSLDQLATVMELVGVTYDDVSLTNTSCCDLDCWVFPSNDSFQLKRPGVDEHDYAHQPAITVEVNLEDDEVDPNSSDAAIFGWMTERGFELDAIHGLDGEFTSYWRHTETDVRGRLFQYVSEGWFTVNIETDDPKLALDFKLRWHT